MPGVPTTVSSAILFHCSAVLPDGSVAAAFPAVPPATARSAATPSSSNAPPPRDDPAREIAAAVLRLIGPLLRLELLVAARVGAGGYRLATRRLPLHEHDGVPHP